MLSILIPEKIPAHNKGEEAILLGIKKTLDFTDDYKIYLYSDSPEYDAKRYRDKVEIITDSLIPSSELSKKEKLAHLLRSGMMHLLYLATPPMLRRKLFSGKLWHIYDEIELIILGHDNAFSFSHNFLILFGKLLGKKVVMYGASILPHVYEKTLPRIITKYCLEKLDLITLREPKSQEFLQRVGLESSKLHVTADKAFLLDPVEKNAAFQLLKDNNVTPDIGPLVGMTVVYGSGVFKRGLLEYKDPREKYSVYTEIMARAVDYLIDECGATVVFMPHTIGPSYSDDDRNVARDVMTKVKDKSGVIAIEGDYSASELKGMIGCCDFFVGARTHSVIAATSMGVPSVVLSYPKDFRTYGIIGDMMEQKRWVYNIEYLKEKELIDLIKAAWDERADTRDRLPALAQRMRERSFANGELLERVMTGALHS